MAKVSFSKLSLKKKEEVKKITINEQEIEVKQYLPVNDKLTLISNIINQSHDDNNFSNPIKLDIFTSLGIIETYTNITFTDKQKEDCAKLFDTLETNGIINQIIAAIPEEEYDALLEGIESCSNAVYTYRNSMRGILEDVTQDYSNLDLNAEEIQKKLADPENMEFLKDVVTKLG